MSKLQIGKDVGFGITRREANFDKACDEACQKALSILGIDEDGHSSNVEGWDRSECSFTIQFITYYRRGPDNHEYRFTVTPARSTEE